MSYHIITGIKELERGVEALIKVCPLMRQAYEVARMPPLRRPENNFRSLARVITGQLLSVASARAIWARVDKLVSPFEPHGLLLLEEKTTARGGIVWGQGENHAGAGQCHFGG